MAEGANDRTAGADGLVTLAVALRPQAVARLRAMAAREGATVEALVALIVEEQLDARGRPAPDVQP